MQVAGTLTHVLLFWGPSIMESFRLMKTNTQPDRHFQVNSMLSHHAAAGLLYYRRCRSTRRSHGGGSLCFLSCHLLLVCPSVYTVTVLVWLIYSRLDRGDQGPDKPSTVVVFHCVSIWRPHHCWSATNISIRIIWFQSDSLAIFNDSVWSDGSHYWYPTTYEDVIRVHSPWRSNR